MSTRNLARLAWSLCAVALALIALALLLVFLGWSTPLPQGWVSWQGWAISSLGIVGAPVLGGLIASRRPRNLYGWLWLGFGLGLGLQFFALAYGAYAVVVEPGSLPAPRTVATVLADAGLTLWISLLPLLLLLFPDGRPLSRRWRFLVWAAVAAGALALVLGPFWPGKSDFAPVENPLGVGGDVGEAIMVILTAAVNVTLGCILLSALSLVFRYWRAGGVERQQIKWFAFAATLLCGTGVSNLFQVLNLSVLWGSILWSAALAGLYVAVGIAILRYRLYEIDRIINRTLVYGVLTAMLAALYLGGVIIGQAIFRFFTGQEEQSQLAIVASTLAIAALFNPLRRRVQAFIDRLFYRRRYDAQQTLATFGARLRDEVDLDDLADDLVGVAKETMQPEHVSLWLREPHRKVKR
ncbi:MAG: hypothetical protein ACRDTR_17675 [Rubrobacter sp.]